ncbi:amidohydrolase family protein [Fluviispira multicolorata]|uniref:Amidohydrolase family protein n=1 Tax=Fluviispira multicolorata TaxID=2654512 RepID=A0A833JAC5_9BACT|nr:amidohydrolase family protein [Fluviispira multicolorata]KAB8027746.1 amidohydrolase family protein [Fluviispira multicolorata]
MVIDFHVHLAGSGCAQSGIILGKSFEKRPAFLYLKYSQKISKEQMLSDIDLIWIKRISDLVMSSDFLTKAVVLCFDSVYNENGDQNLDLSQLYVPNDWGIFATQKFKDTFLLGASVHPYRKDFLDELEKCNKNNVFLIKWLPSAMGIDPEHKLCLPFYEALKYFKIPLLSHADREFTFGEPISGWLKFNHLKKLKVPLEMGVNVIAAHAGTPSQIELAVEMANQYENFYLDTSGLFNPSRARSAVKLFRIAQKSVLKERLLFGTDWPVPVFPLLLVDKTGISFYKEVSKISNPFLRDIRLKEHFGFHIEGFKKNQERLLTMLGRSHTEEVLT